MIHSFTDRHMPYNIICLYDSSIGLGLWPRWGYSHPYPYHRQARIQDFLKGGGVMATRGGGGGVIGGDRPCRRKITI